MTDPSGALPPQKKAALEAAFFMGGCSPLSRLNRKALGAAEWPVAEDIGQVADVAV